MVPSENVLMTQMENLWNLRSHDRLAPVKYATRNEAPNILAGLPRAGVGPGNFFLPHPPMTPSTHEGTTSSGDVKGWVAHLSYLLSLWEAPNVPVKEGVRGQATLPNARCDPSSTHIAVVARQLYVLLPGSKMCRELAWITALIGCQSEGAKWAHISCLVLKTELTCEPSNNLDFPGSGHM